VALITNSSPCALNYYVRKKRKKRGKREKSGERTVFLFIYILLLDQGNQARWGDDGSDQNRYIDSIVSMYRVDQSRIYITGISDGGFSTLGASTNSVCVGREGGERCERGREGERGREENIAKLHQTHSLFLSLLYLSFSL
jgi:hypothetical protein